MAKPIQLKFPLGPPIVSIYKSKMSVSFFTIKSAQELAIKVLLSLLVDMVALKRACFVVEMCLMT